MLFRAILSVAWSWETLKCQCLNVRLGWLKLGLDLGMDQKHQNIYEFDQLCLIACQQLEQILRLEIYILSKKRKKIWDLLKFNLDPASWWNVNGGIYWTDIAIKGCIECLKLWFDLSSVKQKKSIWRLNFYPSKIYPFTGSLYLAQAHLSDSGPSLKQSSDNVHKSNIFHIPRIFGQKQNRE